MRILQTKNFCYKAILKTALETQACSYCLISKWGKVPLWPSLFQSPWTLKVLGAIESYFYLSWILFLWDSYEITQ